MNGTLHVLLTDAEFNLILRALGELPARESFNLLGRLVAEMQTEQQRRSAPPQPKDAPPPVES